MKVLAGVLQIYYRIDNQLARTVIRDFPAALDADRKDLVVLGKDKAVIDLAQPPFPDKRFLDHITFFIIYASQIQYHL